MSESFQPTTFYPVCSHYGHKNCKECSDYHRCEAKLIDESKSLDFDYWNDDADYSPLNLNYRDISESYAYIFDRKQWLAQHLHTLYADGYLRHIPSNIHKDIYWTLISAKNPSDLQNSISNTCVGIFSNVLKTFNVRPDKRAPLYLLLDLKNFERNNWLDLSKNENLILYGKNDLQTLLKPKHRYFKNLQGEVSSFESYISKDCIGEEDNTLIFPKVIAPSKNPYHQKQINYSSISHLYARLMNVISNYDLKNPVLGSFVFTFPKELTNALFKLGSEGEALAWSLFKDFKDDLDKLIFQKATKLNERRHKRPYATSGTLGHRTNLHLWKSSNPLNPHYHFHDSILNYALSGTSDEPTLEPIPYCFSKDDLKEIKRLWTSYLLSLANTLNVDCPTLTLNDSNIGKTILINGEERRVNIADVNYSYTKINLKNKGKVYHILFYQNRDYLVDFAKYSNEHLDCDIPSDTLLNYANRGRSYGLFRKLKALEERMPKKKEENEYKEEDRICPLCGKRMERLGRVWWLEQLPDNLYTYDYDYKTKEWTKSKINRGELSGFCSPLMSLMSGDDPPPTTKEEVIEDG